MTGRRTRTPKVACGRTDRKRRTLGYQLTFHTLAIGSLTCCVSILAIAWVLDQLAYYVKVSGRQADQNHDRTGRGGGGGGAIDQDAQYYSKRYLVGVFDATGSSDNELVRVRNGSGRRWQDGSTR